MVDVVVVGGGVAGRAVAAACSDIGLQVALVAMAPRQGWGNTYSSWLDELGEDTVKVGTSNAFAADWIRSRWGERLEELLSRRVGRAVRLQIAHQSGGPALP